MEIMPPTSVTKRNYKQIEAGQISPGHDSMIIVWVDLDSAVEIPHLETAMGIWK